MNCRYSDALSVERRSNSAMPRRPARASHASHLLATRVAAGVKGSVAAPVVALEICPARHRTMNWR